MIRHVVCGHIQVWGTNTVRPDHAFCPEEAFWVLSCCGASLFKPIDAPDQWLFRVCDFATMHDAASCKSPVLA